MSCEGRRGPEAAGDGGADQSKHPTDTGTALICTGTCMEGLVYANV
jgi:hypothetical protein